MIFDATNMILGRLATQVAKSALEGNDVVVINAEKAILSGDPKGIYDRHAWLKRKVTHRHTGPYYSTRPDLFVKRTVRGMLPYKKARGSEALRRVMVYLGTPDEYKDKEMVRAEKDLSKLGTLKFTSVGEICSRMGWKNANG